MGENETRLRSEIAWKIAPALGQAIPEITTIIHHSSTRRSDGATKKSDIDITLILSDTDLANTNEGRNRIEEIARKVLRQFNLRSGSGPMSVHISKEDTLTINDPERYARNPVHLSFLKEIINKGEVVYRRQ